MQQQSSLYVLVVLLVSVATVTAAADGNRLAYLDEPCDPYYVGLNTAKLVTPQWVGEPGVEAVIVLSIDDLRDTGHHERFLRPILERLKKIDGRAPVSIMTNRVDPNDPQLQTWLEEGLSLETHTVDHPCPCVQTGGISRTKSTYDRCVDMMAEVSNNRPVAFRLPCCDSINTGGPRFFSEVFNKTTATGHFLRIESSVFSYPTATDPTLPREVLRDEEGRSRFDKYIPGKNGFVNFVHDYPYPYVIAHLCWQIPAFPPSDWQAQFFHGPSNPLIARDMQVGIDATVLKQGVFTLVFHAANWMGNQQVLRLIDHAIEKHGRKVKFLNLREVHQRLTENLLGGQPLRAGNGQDNGVRVLDINGDGYMDAVIGNETLQQTRIWSPESARWLTTDFPTLLVRADEQGNRLDTGVRFGVLRKDGLASFVVHNETAAGVWHFDGQRWTKGPRGLDGLQLAAPIHTSQAGRDQGVRLWDVDGDGICELLVGNPRQSAVFAWQEQGGWKRLPVGLPDGTMIVDAVGRDAGFRLADLDADSHADVVFSNARRYSVDLYDSETGRWSNRVMEGRHSESSPVPPIVRADRTNNGVWFKYDHMWIQNEDTAGLQPHLASRHITELLGDGRDPPAR